MNPVLKRELVVRWRGGAVWLMLAVVVLLALLVGFTYATEAGKSTSGDALSQMSLIGRELFQVLALVQVLGWVLLAPSLTATAISGERERGLLDALRLSRLSAARIVWGKFGGALFFVLQIAFGVLPLIAICFLMGGVAPGEFALAAWLQIVTAIFGLSLGLYFSSINRRSSGAIIATLAFALAWFFVSVFAAFLADGASRGGNWATPIYKPLWIIGLTNPFFVAVTSLQKSPGTPVSPFTFAPDWITSSALLLAISALFLWGAMRAVRRSQEREPRVLAAPQKSRRFFARRNTNKPREYSQAPRAARTHWHLLPPASTRNFNPLLRRELHARLRIPLPHGVWRLWALLGIAAAFGCFALVWWNWHIGELKSRDVWAVTVFCDTILLALIATVIGALSLARERENGTWEMLRLSLLSPGEVLRAKFLSIIAACAVYSIAAWPLLLLGAWPTVWPTLNFWWSGLPLDARTRYGVLWPEQFCWSLLVAAVTGILCAAWGLLVSWRFSKVSTAVAWAVGSVFVLFGVVPFLGIIVGSGTRVEGWLNQWHPLMVLSDLLSSYWQSQRFHLPKGFIAFCFFWLSATAMMLTILYRELRHDLRPARKENGASTRAPRKTSR